MCCFVAKHTWLRNSRFCTNVMQTSKTYGSSLCGDPLAIMDFKTSKRRDSSAIPIACSYSWSSAHRWNILSTTSCNLGSMSSSISPSACFVRSAMYLSMHFAVTIDASVDILDRDSTPSSTPTDNGFHIFWLLGQIKEFASAQSKGQRVV